MNIWKNTNVLGKIGTILLCCYLLATLASCAGVPYKNVVFRHSPPSVAGKLIPINVGIDEFDDVRSADEKDKMAALSDIPQEVTIKFADYLRHSQVFSDARLIYESEEIDVKLKGKIKNFNWENVDNSPVFLVPSIILWPLLFYPLLGLPTGRVSCHVGIEVSLENPQTGEIIAAYSEEHKLSKRFNIYTMQDYKGSRGIELNDALREVSGKIIERIFADRNKILDQ